MEDSILTSTKKKLGLTEEYDAFDEDIITYINSTFAILSQLGIGPVGGYMIEDETEQWPDFLGPNMNMNLVRSYVALKVRMLFDPPTTSFLIEALNKQISEFEYRLSVFREENPLWVDRLYPQAPLATVI